MGVIKHRTNGVLGTQFLNNNPDWADMAYEVLFRRDRKGEKEGYWLQHAVAEALKVAYEMGKAGRKPPWPSNRDPRKYEPPPADPETEQIANELRLLAWTPLAGTPQPEGHMKWKMEKIFADRERAKPAPGKVVVRRKPDAVPTTKLVRRSR